METTTTNSSSTQQQLPQTQQITFPYKLLDGVVVCVCANLNVLIDTGSPSSIGNNISQFNLLGKTFNLASNFMGINLNSFTEQFGQKLDILLGTDVLSKFDFLIDSQRMSVTFWTIDGLNTANPNTTTNTSTANTNTNTNTNETNTNAETSTTATTTTLTTTSTNVVPLPNFGVCSDDTFTSVNMQYMIGVPVIGIAIPNRTLAAIFDTGIFVFCLLVFKFFTLFSCLFCFRIKINVCSSKCCHSISTNQSCT